MDHYYCCLFDTLCNCIVCVQVVSHVSLAEGGYLSDDGQVHIICTQYLFDRMAVSVVTSAGDIILWNVTTNEVYPVHVFTISSAYLFFILAGHFAK